MRPICASAHGAIHARDPATRPPVRQVPAWLSETGGASRHARIHPVGDVLTRQYGMSRTAGLSVVRRIVLTTVGAKDLDHTQGDLAVSFRLFLTPGPGQGDQRTAPGRYRVQPQEGPPGGPSSLIGSLSRTRGAIDAERHDCVLPKPGVLLTGLPHPAPYAAARNSRTSSWISRDAAPSHAVRRQALRPPRTVNKMNATYTVRRTDPAPALTLKAYMEGGP